MSSRRYQLAGLMGFIVSALFFLAGGIRDRDPLSILGTIAWIVACLVWMIPLLNKKGEK